MSTVFSGPSYGNFYAVIFVGKFVSVPVIDFVLRSISIANAVYVRELGNDNRIIITGLVRLRNSFSAVYGMVFPAKTASVIVLSTSGLGFFALSSNGQSFAFSELLESRDFSWATSYRTNAAFAPLSGFIVVGHVRGRGEAVQARSVQVTLLSVLAFLRVDSCLPSSRYTKSLHRSFEISASSSSV